MRTRINERLARAAQYPVTLIVAPAGFGKSSALRDFIETSRLEVLRYDVRREDNTLLTFVQRLAQTLEPVAPGAVASFPSIQERVLASAEPVRQLSDWFGEHLKLAVCTIVIDDLHYAAADPASIALLADLIERCGDRIKWIVAARSDVGLPIGTWIAYGRMDLPLGEDELRFTTEEALAAAGTDVVGDAHEIESLRQLTEGWPVALTIALRTRTHSRDLRSASLGTREMVYRYLAEQVFAGLTEDQRSFALATSVFPAFDIAIAERFGESASWLHDFRARVAFLNEVAPGQFRYHDLFRDFLETELRRGGERAWSAAVCKAAQILESRGDQPAALTLYAKAHSYDDILRIVNDSGFALFERGEGERLAAALDVLPERAMTGHAAALGLKAVIEAGRGRFSVVEPSFTAAIEAAAENLPLRLFLVHRYAIELVRHERDCSAFLEPYAFDEAIDNAQRAPLLGTLATAYARADRYQQAVETIERALASMNPAMHTDLQARIYQQAAYVYHTGAATEKTRYYADAAISLASAHNLHDVAARAYTALFTVTYNEDDDPIASLRILDKLEEHALKGASVQPHLFALISYYEIEADLGNEAALVRFGEALREQQAILPQARIEALAPANAFRAAWHAHFDQAYSFVQPTLANLTAPDRRALRAAEIAVYALAARRNEDGDEALEQAARALEQSLVPNRRTVRARCFIALAQLLRGHAAAAHRQLTEAEKNLLPSMRRLRVLIQALRTLHRSYLGEAEEGALHAALERLRSEKFGGMANLLEVLPVGRAAGHAYGMLTSAERQILQLLASGASTKDIANATARSPHTVDTHIRSLCRKLNCSGRREAVALATAQGWV